MLAPSLMKKKIGSGKVRNKESWRAKPQGISAGTDVGIISSIIFCPYLYSTHGSNSWKNTGQTSDSAHHTL